MEYESILTSIKKALSVPDEISDFDPEIIMYINGVLSYLTELGVGPREGVQITGEDEKWDLLVSDNQMNDVKSLVYLRVRMIFDPPTITVLEKSYTDLLRELEWRIREKVEEDALWLGPITTPQTP